ncbi:MAG TPA: ABC-type transport auxiliary lipoprotein family protein [Burkholderiales bacterium]|nr:ABC-type transport auxiliary lipoprotein family protein [Burkholderiales bacterium]
MKIRTALCLVSLLAFGAGCAPAVRGTAQVYDFGLPPKTEPLAAVRVMPVESPPWLDRSDMLYRATYRDPRVLQSFAYSLWTGTPATMLTLRLRQTIGDTAPSSAKCSLHVALEEFSQVFDAETSSRAVLYAHAELMEIGGARRHDSTTIRLERPTPTPDAAGGAAAFSALADEMARGMKDWIAHAGYCG